MFNLLQEGYWLLLTAYARLLWIRDSTEHLSDKRRGEKPGKNAAGQAIISML